MTTQPKITLIGGLYAGEWDPVDTFEDWDPTSTAVYFRTSADLHIYRRQADGTYHLEGAWEAPDWSKPE